MDLDHVVDECQIFTAALTAALVEKALGLAELLEEDWSAEANLPKVRLVPDEVEHVTLPLHTSLDRRPAVLALP